MEGRREASQDRSLLARTSKQSRLKESWRRSRWRCPQEPITHCWVAVETLWALLIWIWAGTMATQLRWIKALHSPSATRTIWLRSWRLTWESIWASSSDSYTRFSPPSFEQRRHLGAYCAQILFVVVGRVDNNNNNKGYQTALQTGGKLKTSLS